MGHVRSRVCVWGGGHVVDDSMMPAQPLGIFKPSHTYSNIFKLFLGGAYVS